MKRFYFALVLFISLSGSFLFSAPIEFTAELVSYAPNTPPATLTVETTPGNELEVQVTAFTEIKDTDGDSILLAELAPGDFLKIEARLTGSGWIADEVERVQDQDADFDLKGAVQAADGTSLTVNGISVLIEEGTSVKDEYGEDITWEAFLERVASTPLLFVKVEGHFSGEDLVASSVKLQLNFLKIVLEGIIAGDPEPDRIMVDTGEEPIIPVGINDATRIHGTLVDNAAVKVIGYLDSTHLVQARMIHVLHLFELAPDELEMDFNESRTVDVTLSRPLESDFNLFVCSNEDPSVAAVLSELPVVIAAGEMTGSFEVGSFELDGETKIVLSPDCEGGESRNLEIRVGEGDEGEEEKSLEVKWAPEVIHAAPEGSRVVRLVLRHGIAREELTVQLSKEPSDLGVEFPAEVTIPAGANFVTVDLEFTDPDAVGSILAILAGEEDGEPAVLEIEIRNQRPDEAGGAGDGGPGNNHPGDDDHPGNGNPGNDDHPGNGNPGNGNPGNGNPGNGKPGNDDHPGNGNPGGGGGGQPGQGSENP